MGPGYRTAGRLRVRDRQWSGERVQGQDRQRSKTMRTRKRETRETLELIQKTLVDLTNKTNWQQTNREHRYKYTGDNDRRWKTRVGGWSQSQRQVKQIRL